MDVTDRNCGTCCHTAGEERLRYYLPIMRCDATPHTGKQYEDELAWMAANDADYPAWTDAEWLAHCYPGATAFTADASTYSSSLMVLPEHYCSMWEPKP